MNLDAIHSAAAGLGPHEIASRLGLDVARSSTRDRVRVECPWHSPDRHPSCDLAVKDGRIVVHCQSCREGGDLLSLVAVLDGLDLRLDFVAVARRAAEIVGVPPIEDETPRRKRRTTRYELVRRRVQLVDGLVDDYLRGREIQRSDELRSASSEELIEAFAVFDSALEIEAAERRKEFELDDALDRVGDELESLGVIDRSAVSQ